MIDKFGSYISSSNILKKLDFVLIKSAEFIFYVLLSFIIYRIIKYFLKGILKNKISQKYIKEKKLNLLYSIILNIVKYVIYFIAILVILKKVFNINPALIITATGILGLAVGLGIQGLLKDFISGLFILFEDKFNIGDYVNINKIKGKVTNINIKNVTIKSIDGKISIIPNRLINSVERYSSKNIDIIFSVFFKEDIKKMKKFLEQIKTVINNMYKKEIKNISRLYMGEKIGEYKNIKFSITIIPYTEYIAEHIRKILEKNFSDILIETRIGTG